MYIFEFSGLNSVMGNTFSAKIHKTHKSYAEFANIYSAQIQDSEVARLGNCYSPSGSQGLIQRNMQIEVCHLVKIRTQIYSLFLSYRT